MERALTRYRSYLSDRRDEKNAGTRSFVKRTKLITYVGAVLDARPLAVSIPSVDDSLTIRSPAVAITDDLFASKHAQAAFP